MEIITKDLLENEIYRINRPNGTIVYAPLTRSFLFAEEQEEELHLPSEWLDEATSSDNVPQFVQESLEGRTDPAIRLRINITNGCNLSCEYCSVNAKKKAIKHMSEEMARTAIKYFVEKCRQQGKKLELTFSGGEPTIAVDLIDRIVTFVKELTTLSDIQLSTKILTNGVFNREAEKIIADQFESVQISWDGDLKNNPRYGKNSNTANIVRANIGKLVEKGVPISLLTVVSEYNQASLDEIVDDVYHNMGVNSHFLSMRDPVGRATGRETLDYQRIAELYFKLWHTYRVLGSDINLTGTNIHAISRFPCAVAAPNYAIDPTGSISACTIAFNDDASKIKKFNIGKVTDQVHLRPNQIDQLKVYAVENKTGCQRCFAKWHCRGGCPFVFGNGMAESDPQRCDLVKDVIANKLLWIIENE